VNPAALNIGVDALNEVQTLSWYAKPNVKYRIECSKDLVTWDVVESSFTGTPDAYGRLIYTGPEQNVERVYYRITES
jgi:hypothetical protein